MPETRLRVRDGQLREDEGGQLGVYLCDECATLNAGYGACPYCMNAAACVVVRTVEDVLLTMEGPLAERLGVAPVQLNACRCCNEPPRDPHGARIHVRKSDVSQRYILTERRDGHTHVH